MNCKKSGAGVPFRRLLREEVRDYESLFEGQAQVEKTLSRQIQESLQVRTL